MLKLSRKSEYGIIALKHMLNQPEESVTTARDIAHVYNIPPEVMAKIMQTLARNGIVNSCQGAKGGYLLGRKAESISLSDIIETIEGPLGIVECVSDEACECVQLNNCNISDPFKIIQRELQRFLSNISLADLNNEVEMQHVVWH